MIYRIIKIEFDGGGVNYFPERLTWRGFKSIGSRPFSEEAAAENCIKSHRNRKITRRYFFL